LAGSPGHLYGERCVIKEIENRLFAIDPLFQNDTCDTRSLILFLQVKSGDEGDDQACNQRRGKAENALPYKLWVAEENLLQVHVSCPCL
jgi:hypothetical protein